MTAARKLFFLVIKDVVYIVAFFPIDYCDCET